MSLGLEASNEIVTLLHRESVKALALANVKVRLIALGYVGIGTTPDEFSTQINAELARWTKVIKTAGIKAQE